MKDWKNYAIFLLALWCVWLTWRTTEWQTSRTAPNSTVDFTDRPPILDTDGTSMVWTGNGELTLDCYCKLSPQTSGSVYSVLQRCRLTFAADGQLVRAEILPVRSRLKADCRTNAKTHSFTNAAEVLRDEALRDFEHRVRDLERRTQVRRSSPES